MGDDVRYPPGALQDHAGRPVQHGVVYRLRETETDGADGEMRGGAGGGKTTDNSRLVCLDLRPKPHTPQGWSHRSLEVRQINKNQC